MKNKIKIFTLDEICVLAEINKRKVRYYIQNNLVDRPDGAKGGKQLPQRGLGGVGRQIANEEFFDGDFLL